MSELHPEITNEVDRRMALAREWDDLVKQVRHLDGFEEFLRPPSLEALLPAARDGPIAIVNVSRWRCDALIVTAEGVRPRKLPLLTLDDAVERTNTYLETLQVAERAAATHAKAAATAQTDPRPSTIRAQLDATKALIAAEQTVDTMLRATQEWMWDVITEAVLDELGLIEVPAADAPWPRMWWCPTGPLTLLPLHAAGYHDGRAGIPQTVIDRVVCSYTPTVRALLEAQKARDENGVHTSRFLLVAVPDAPGQVRLPAVDRERATVERLIPPGRRTVLEGSAATRDAVDRALRTHEWVHFSCHGDQNLANPSRGGLLLHDGMLSIADIAAREFSGEFAGLSACKTAVGGVDLLEEVITLAAALHYTGYRHVVASLWSVDDGTSAEVFDAVYHDLVHDGAMKSARASVALHRVLRDIRDRAPDEPRLWTPFTHTGP